MIRNTTALLVGAVLLASVEGAQATAYCPVKETRDGFVALRASPSAEARLVARMRGGDEVRLLGDRRGAWEAVEWWRGDARLDPPGRKARAGGWVHRDLIGECG